MGHFTYTGSEESKYKIAILVKKTSHRYQDMVDNYVQPMVNQGIPAIDIISFTLEYNAKDKCPVSLAKTCLASLLKQADSLGVTTLFVADAIYFKVLTGERKAEPHYGYILPCKMKGFEHMKVILSLNHKALFYNPQLKPKLIMAISTLVDHVIGVHIKLGTGIIQTGLYPENLSGIADAILGLHQYDALTCDIEGFSLQFIKAGIGTIAFAWDQNNGTAFRVDYTSSEEESRTIRKMLLNFFQTYEGTLIYHGGTYDIKVLIYQLFMGTTGNYKGMIKGLETMYRNVDDSMLVTYLATNSTARNQLGLKENAFEFAGNYAKEDINDITKIPIGELLEYNLVDALSTWYVYNKHYPTMVKDMQEDVYRDRMLPSMKVVTHMELVGMPLNIGRVKEVDKELSTILYVLENNLQQTKIIIEFENFLRKEAVTKKNLTLKKLVKTERDFLHVEYNPGSPLQTAKLVYDFLGFEVQDRTDTGQPATGAKTLKKLLNQLKIEHNITDEDLL